MEHVPFNSFPVAVRRVCDFGDRRLEITFNSFPVAVTGTLKRL
ncbi:MAG: hypothetical protein N3E41_08845 [Thermofilaceae archaeon]|nr:hypothetical protein [Thermofilaceae archaeon]